MVKLFKSCLITSLLFWSYCANSQNIDSVLTSLNQESIVSQIRSLDDLAWDYMYTNFEYAYNYALQANKIAVENDLSKSAATTFNTLGVVCRRRGWYTKSKEYYRKAAAIWIAQDNIKELTTFSMNMANVLRNEGYFDSALLFGEKGVQYASQLGDSSRMADMYIGIGDTYKKMGWDETAVEYLTKGATIEQNLGDTVDLGYFWSNLGDVLVKLEDYEGALDYHLEVLKIDESSNNLLNQSISWNSIGVVYQKLGYLDKADSAFDTGIRLADELGDELLALEIQTSKAQLLVEKRQIDEALDMFSKILVDMEDFDDPGVKSSAALGYGSALMESGKTGEGIDLLLTANEISTTTGFGEIIIASHQKLAAGYGELGQITSAFHHLQKYVELNDSLKSASTQARITELENKYDLQNKDYQIALQTATIRQNEVSIQRNRAVAVIIALLLLSVIGVIVWVSRRRHYKLKLNLESERRRLKEEQIKSVILSQEKERRRFAMDLHDGFGQLISALKLNVSQQSETSKSEDILDKMYSSLKNIAFDLMPHTLFEKGLNEALEELVEQVNGSGVLVATLQTFGLKNRINDDQKIAVYRITQELLSNIIKYAGASKINISLTDLGNGFLMLVEDNGDGFDLDHFRNAPGNGWKNIKSRLELLHGEIEFDTMIGRKNTTVSIEVPYSQVEDRSKAA